MPRLRRSRLSVMGNRSDRRLANLTNRKALEAVGPIRTSRADFHQGPERQTQLHTEAGYTTATGFAFTSANDLALGAGSIYGSSNLPCSATQSVVFTHNPEIAENPHEMARFCGGCERERTSPAPDSANSSGFSPGAEKPVRFTARTNTLIYHLGITRRVISRSRWSSTARAIRAADRSY